MVQRKKNLPEDLIDYYERRLRELDPKGDPSQSLLAEVFEGLIVHNRKLLDGKTSANC